MSSPINPIRVNHLNMVLEDFDVSLEHFEKLYDGVMLMDLPKTTWHACLVDVGRVIFEIFAPDDFFLHTRYGPHFLGIEYQADMDEVREVIRSKGIRIARDIDVALHTHPDDCHGVALEFFGGYFHDNEELMGTKMRPAQYWSDESPLGITALRGYTIVVQDLDKATSFFQGVMKSEGAYEQTRPAISGKAVGLQIADAVVELLAPSGSGLVQDHLLAHSEGIRSALFGVRDLDQVRLHFKGQGIELVAGFAPDTLAIPAELNRGVVFEFAE